MEPTMSMETKVWTTDRQLENGNPLECLFLQGLIDAAVDNDKSTAIYLKRFRPTRWVPYLEVIPAKPIHQIRPLEGHPDFIP